MYRNLKVVWDHRMGSMKLQFFVLSSLCHFIYWVYKFQHVLLLQHPKDILPLNFGKLNFV